MVAEFSLAAFALLVVTSSGFPEGSVPLKESEDSAKEAQNSILPEVGAGKYDWVDVWKAPGRLNQWLPYAKIGKDHENATVYLNPYGKWNFRDMVVQGTPEEQNAIDKYIERVTDGFSRASEQNNDDGAVLIFDFDGFGLRNYAHPEAARLALQQFGKLGRIYKATKYGFAVNVNFAAELFINSARPFLGTLLEKFEIYGTQPQRWMPRLLRKIPKEVLPVAYGGTNEIELPWSQTNQRD